MSSITNARVVSGGRQKRRSRGTDRWTCVASLPTQPVPIVRTGASMSWIASPDSAVEGLFFQKGVARL